MRPADGIPRFFLPAIARAFFSRGSSDVETWTRLSRDQWRKSSSRYPMLGADPGPNAAAARRRLSFLIGRALSTPRHGPRLKGEPPLATPTVYISAHLGDLRSIRYLLRDRGIRVAHVLAPENLERLQIEAEDREFDRQSNVDFPHVFDSSNPIRLARALKRGSLILAADRPAGISVPVPILGGTIELDSRPLRLARIAGVPARGIFLTAPRGNLTLTVGPILGAADDEGNLRAFGGLLAAVAARSPYEFDMFSHR